MPKRLVKTAFRKFIMKENGAVSIYAVIVVLLIFLFNAVLIDFVRIMVAEYQTDQATKTAMRSAFSGYDKDVQDKGLFVLSPDGEDPATIFSTVFEENLAVDDDGYFQFVDTTMESTSFDSSEGRSFANKEIVKHQILEDMKYKAPIEFGKVIVDGILPFTCAMKDAEVVVDVSEEVEGIIDNRDGKMDSAFKHIGNAKETFGGTDSLVNNPSSSPSTYPHVANLMDIHDFNDEYLEDEDKDSTYKEESRDVLNNMKSDAESAKKDVKKAIKAIKKAKKKNEKIGKTIEEVEEEVEEKYEDIANDQCSEASVGDAEEEMESVTEELEGYEMDAAYFDDALEKLEAAKKSIDDDIGSTTLKPFIQAQLDDLDGMLEEESITPTKNILQDRFKVANDDVKNAHSYIVDGYEKKPEAEESDGFGFSDALNALKKLKEILGKGKALQKDFGTYDDLEDLVNDYGSALSEDAGDLDMDDPTDSAKDSFNIIREIFSSLSDMGKSMRDKSYVNEYILTRFQSKEKMGLLEPSSYPDTFLFKNREVEYILYGQHVPGLNYTYALMELTGVRFALNFVAAFTRNEVKIVPLPWAKVVAALVWALGKTIEDIGDLTNGRGVDLLHVKGVNFKVDYKFYLRLFLFLHPDSDDNRIHRIQAVIDHKKKGVSLLNAPIYATAKAESSVKLWFLPGVIEMFGIANVLDGRVEDGRYHIEKEIDYSY